MKNKLRSINRDIERRTIFVKNELRMLILKSVIQNLGVKPVVRSLAKKKLCKLNYKYSISRQKNNICLLSGRMKGVTRLTNISRHFMKKLGSVGNLQNIQIKSW